VWTDLAAGTPLDIALEHGERRALTIANTDLQLAKTHTAKKVMADDERVVGYRRVPQGPHTCAMCLIVSTRRYHKENLAAIHANCDCDVEAIYGHFDPGPVLDEAFLKAVHDAIRRDLGADYVADSGKLTSTAKREQNYTDIVITHEHGEIGSVLGVRGQHFTGPAEVKRLTHHKIE
jgi:NAD(P)H-hydrate repair Nnr-like enzyme with NAD(P)H-hydrate dehydratase domain